ncbi:hypothetical protein GC169_05205 [bacterium]|nr:hypothetical protein [bacterium]
MTASPPIRLSGWPDYRDFALGLGLPELTETTAWGSPCIKAHGKLWAWWPPAHYANAPAFKVDRDEFEFLLEAAPETFFTSDHHRPYSIILMRPDRFDADWARRNLTQSWRALAPRRFLKAWDARSPAPEA